MVLVYSCCFWFSLRLAGILIGFFSVIQAVLGIIAFAIVYKHQQDVKEQLSLWMKNLNLIYVNGYLENFQADPEKYITYSIVILSIYIFFCILFIYGAYVCNNAAMIGFILIEMIRLITLSILVTTWLLVLKQNTMDIGLVIGASVASGFTLLGMFYLWVCAAALPMLINEMEREEQKAKIDKLEQLLEYKKQRFNPLLSTFDDDDEDLYNKQLFVIPRNNFSKSIDERRMNHKLY
ncbi:uncharacterized protein LOC123880887 [Maniola jurtina]|uniref:uncharacterized protein LOC123880887 n=1 Tax=Maniola jurtina TaxID=191418 RepID=UPI001E688549|nr:uncharacterized protein LOC123880887 [Maniola jurtina]